jgi:perosamine synthetase
MRPYNLENDVLFRLRKTLNLKKKNEKAFLHEPNFDQKEIKYLNKCVKSTFVSTAGEFVKLFEKKIKKITNSKYVLSLINGTTALHLCLKILGVQNDDEILVPSITFAGTANAIKMAGATPHFVDSETENFGIDPIKLEAYLKKTTVRKNNFLINKKTKKRITALIVVHVFGHPAKIDDILKITKKFKIPVIEDAAECIGSYYKKRHLGTFSDIGILSFNGNKTITTGGGGALLTNNRKLYEYANLLSNGAKEFHKWEYIHSEPGYNYKMPAINAALGLGQLEKLKNFLKKKRSLFKRYEKNFKNFKQAKILKEPKKSKSNYWLQALILEKKYYSKKNKILTLTNNKNIFTRPIWKPLHLLKHFKKNPMMNLKNAEEIYEKVINLPSGSKFIK